MAAHKETFVYSAADERITYSESGNPVRAYTYATGHRIKAMASNPSAITPMGVSAVMGPFSTRLMHSAGSFEYVQEQPSSARLSTTPSVDRSSIRQSSEPVRSLNYFGDFVEQETEDGTVRQITIDGVTGLAIAYHIPGHRQYSIFDGRHNLIALADLDGLLIETTVTKHSAYRIYSMDRSLIYDSQRSASIRSRRPAISFECRVVPLQISNDGSYQRSVPVSGILRSIDRRRYNVYAAQNPIDLIDPTGECAKSPSATIITKPKQKQFSDTRDSHHRKHPLEP
jgi:hypothetical protein